MRALRMTIPAQRVLRALLAEPTRERYGVEIGAEAGLRSSTIHPILGRLKGAAPGPAAFLPSRRVCLAARCLPKGTVRERDRAGFLAELPGLTNRRQIRHAAGLLVHARVCAWP
jgi:hypothetical protein